jgi:hypothetical protein
MHLLSTTNSAAPLFVWYRRNRPGRRLTSDVRLGYGGDAGVCWTRFLPIDLGSSDVSHGPKLLSAVDDGGHGPATH